MKKFLIAVCSIVLVIGASGCVGKAPMEKGRLHLRSLRGADRIRLGRSPSAPSLARMVESGGKLLRLAAFLVRI